MKRFFLFLLLIGSLLPLSACARRSYDRFYFGDYSEAEKFYKKQQYEKAVEKYQAFVEDNPSSDISVTASFYLAKSHAALGHTEQAKSIFEKIIRKHANLPWADFSKLELESLNSGSESNLSETGK